MLIRLLIILLLLNSSSASAELDRVDKAIVYSGIGAVGIGAYSVMKGQAGSQPHGTSDADPFSGHAGSTGRAPNSAITSTPNSVSVNINPKTIGSFFSGLFGEQPQRLPPSMRPINPPASTPPKPKEDVDDKKVLPPTEVGEHKQPTVHEQPSNNLPNSQTPAYEGSDEDFSVLERNDSRILDRNMGGNRPPGYAAHHIIPVGIPSAEALRFKLNRFNIDINDAANGIYLPNSEELSRSSGLPNHRSIDTTKYIIALYDRIMNLNTEAEIKSTLKEIGTEILEKRFP